LGGNRLQKGKGGKFNDEVAQKKEKAKQQHIVRRGKKKDTALPAKGTRKKKRKERVRSAGREGEERGVLWTREKKGSAFITSRGREKRKGTK